MYETLDFVVGALPDYKEARISTLQKNIKLGFGGHLELSIKL